MLEIAHLFVGAAALTVLLAAAMQDVRQRLIANRLSLALLALGLARHALAAFVLGSLSWTILLPAAAALAVFAVGYALWRAGGVGGGDVKLLAATAFFVGPESIGVLIMVTTLVGGLLALGYVAWTALRSFAAMLWPTLVAPPASDNASTARSPTIPYGVAIAVGAAVIILPSLPTVLG